MTNNTPIQIKNIRIPSQAGKKDYHYWADYLELLCVFNKDRLVAQNDFIDRLSPQKDLEDGEEFHSKGSKSELNDSRSLHAEDTFSIISYRSAVFKDSYPFYLSADNKSIHLNDSISERQKIYLFLLFSSSLGVFKQYTSTLTSSFERLSLEVMKNLIPKNASAQIFGSSNIESLDTEQNKNGLFWEKLNKLSGHLRERVLIDESELSNRNRGDGGLDLYAWSDLGDENKHFPIFFGQCACTPEWEHKQHSSKFDSWNEFITLSTYPLNLIFIPYSFRKANGEWHETYKIKKSILLDRQRMLHLLDADFSDFKTFESYDIINNLITQNEPII